MSTVRLQKSDLRAEYLARRRAIPDDMRAHIDAQICRALLASASFRFAKTVLVYAPTRYEVDISPLFEEARRQGKALAFPRCIERGVMTFHIAEPQDLVIGAHNIRAPREDAPLLTDTGASVCLVPAVVFDTHGYRIGYGGGYYDRFLSQYDGTTVGITRDGFILPELPRGRYDRAVHAIVTEKGVRPVK